jgi:flagellar basal body rod protein FlgG
VQVGTDGLVSQNGAAVGRIRLATVPDLDALAKAGQGLFAHRAGTPLTLVEAFGAIRQGAVERSSVNEIDALMQITSASKSAQSNIGMIDMQNRLLDRLVNTFGRIA